MNAGTGLDESFSPIVIEPRMRAILQLVERLAPASIPILLLGETGCGKEVLAECVHRSSRRRSKPFVRINCAGLSESVVESELFGHEKGAFTSALGVHRGLFEVADGGTLFLDEIAELPLRTQAKLLRVLESGEFMRLGSTEQRKVRVRILSATHDDLLESIRRGAFRRDLYFRLNGATLRIPPLCERRLEILPLAQLFLERCSQREGCHTAGLAPDAQAALLDYSWPGNLRELRNVMERAAAMAAGGPVRAEHLGLSDAHGLLGCFGATPPSAPHVPATPAAAHVPAAESARLAQPAAGAASPRDMRAERRAFERRQIMAALGKTGGNQTQAAKVLGIARRTLTNKLNAHAIERPRKTLGSASGTEGGGLGNGWCGGGG